MVHNQAALRALDNPESISNSIRNAKSILNLLGKTNFIVLRWIKAHVNWKYNEVADKLAKKGADPNCKRFGDIPMPSKRSIYSDVENMILRKWTYRWQQFDDCRQSKYFWGSPSKSKSQCIISFPRETVSRAVRYLTGHAFLRRHNAIVEQGVSPPWGDVSCRLCEDPDMDETPHHLITECEALHFWRHETLGAHILDEFPRWKTRNLIKFIRDRDLILLECD